jgi:hypothetical protein
VRRAGESKKKLPPEGEEAQRGLIAANTFWVYGGLNVLFILLTIWLIPETKNVSLEHIERNLMQGSGRWRRRSYWQSSWSRWSR